MSEPIVVEYDKLVRDNIPELLKSDTNVIEYETYTINKSGELIKYIINKLIEEATELRDTLDEQGNVDIGELADVYEVFEKLRHEVTYSQEELLRAANAKAKEKGKFNFNIVLKSIKKEK